MATPWDLDFADSRKAAQKHLGRKLEILRPLIRFSHDSLRDCRDVSLNEVDLVLATAFRQCLEFADAVDILLRHMAIAPAAAQARGALEQAPQVVLLATTNDPVLSAAYLLSSMRHLEHELTRKKNASGLDAEDRQSLQEGLEGIERLYSEQSQDRAGKEALSALKAIRAGRPWYAIRNGPENIHQLLKQLDLAPLSHFYSDLNPVVHGGMPLLATAAASGLPGSEKDPEWLRPLRVPSPWGFRPILATGMAVNIALLYVLVHFGSRLPKRVAAFREFKDAHNERCRRAEMPVLVLAEP